MARGGLDPVDQFVIVMGAGDLGASVLVGHSWPPLSEEWARGGGVPSFTRSPDKWRISSVQRRPNAQPPMTSLGQCTPRMTRVAPIASAIHTAAQTATPRQRSSVGNSKARHSSTIVAL